jgi:hypothetical protein
MDARWAQMGHEEVFKFLMHLGRYNLCVVTCKMPDDPAEAAARQEVSNYVTHALQACFESYEEDMEKRRAEAKKGKRVAPNLSEAFQFYVRAALPPATNTPETQNDGTNAQDGPVWPNPDMEQQRQGVNQRRLHAEGLWQAHVIERFGAKWVDTLVDGAPVVPMTPEEQAQWPWKPEPLPKAAGEGGLPTAGEEAKPKGKKARKGKVSPKAPQEAVAKTGVRQTLEGELAWKEQLLAALDAEQAAGGGEKEGGERGSRGESSAGKGARKQKRPAEPVSTPEEVVQAGAKRKKRAEKGKKAAAGEEKSAESECHPMEETAAGGQSAAGEQVASALEAREGEKAATGEKKSAGMVSPPREEGTAGLQSSVGMVTAPTQEVQVPPVGPVGQPEAQSEDGEAGSEDLEAESDDFEKVFSVETDGTDVCESVQRLIPSNLIASEAMDLLARRERWALFDEESEDLAFRIFVDSLLDAAQRALLTTLTWAECERLVRNNMVWMGRAGRHASAWEEVEAQGVSYEKLARQETTAMLGRLAKEAAEAEAPTNGAGPSHAAPMEEGPSQGAATQARRGEPSQPPVTSRGVQTENAAEEGTFLLEPLLQNAMAIAVHDLVGGVDVEIPS